MGVRAGAGTLAPACWQGSVRLRDLPGGHEDRPRDPGDRVRVLRVPPLPGLRPTPRVAAGTVAGWLIFRLFS